MPTTTEPQAAMSLDELKHRGPIDFVDDDKCYSLTIQLGSNRCWGKYSGGRWVRDPEADVAGETRAYKHIPICHDVESVPGKMVNGLIQSANEWLEANRDRAVPEGIVARQITVFNIEETDKLPDNEPALRITPSNLAEVAKGAVAAAFEAAFTESASLKKKQE